MPSKKFGVEPRAPAQLRQTQSTPDRIEYGEEDDRRDLRPAD
jgi:hypothetical protein